MPRYPSDSRVQVADFVRQPSGEDTVIGLPETETFLAIPSEAVEVLDWLAAGATVGAAATRHAAEHGEEPDLEDFLTGLESYGFLRPESDSGSTGAEPASRVPSSTQPRYHFDAIPQRIARRIFHPVVVAGAMGLILIAAVTLVTVPQLRPGWRNLAFGDHVALVFFSVLLFDFLCTFVHEMGHLVAARALGIGARLGIGNRLWILVAETDMTGIWKVPPRQRYLPLLAGPLVDATCGALLTLFLLGHRRGLWPVSEVAVQVLQAMLLLYLLRLLWQCYFFVRTDFYYAIANAFGCKNLMGDTVTYLTNRLRHLLRRPTARDQSHIPRREMRVIRAYAVVWLLGRVVALWVLFAFALPLALHYLSLLTRGLTMDPSQAPLQFAESLLMTLTSFLLFATGLGLWIRQLLTSRSDRQ